MELLASLEVNPGVGVVSTCMVYEFAVVVVVTVYCLPSCVGANGFFLLGAIQQFGFHIDGVLHLDVRY